VKKLRRSKIRRANALNLSVGHNSTTEELADNHDSDGHNETAATMIRLQSNESTMGKDSASTCLPEDEDEILHSLEEAAWLERERQSQLAFQMKCAENQKREITRIAEEVHILLVCYGLFCNNSQDVRYDILIANYLSQLIETNSVGMGREAKD